jgi:ABC-type nitrate/sulfonate/bicarbonate transport system permease component
MQKVRLRASLPSLFAALKLAAPAALLGAIIGEYLGGESGLGVAMIASEQSLNVERTWGIALVATAVAGLAYSLISFIGARLTTWAPKAPTR